jgi:2-polyprenyl-3-methyl-5-hydroxy-6-metoxy-1,4-benzoquinol methylase
MGVVDRTAEIVRRCRGKRVLHLGCADWPYTAERIETQRLLHSEIAAVSSHVIGVDMSSEGLELMRWLNPSWDLRLHDACTYIPPTNVDVIVASELIEHLDNPGDLLGGLASWATPQHELVITTPNGYSLKGALRAVVGKEFCHPDHTVMFTTKTLSQILARNGWMTTDVLYYQCMPQAGLQVIPAFALQTLATLFAPRTSDGLIVVARRTATGAQAAEARKVA